MPKVHKPKNVKKHRNLLHITQAKIPQGLPVSSFAGGKSEKPKGELSNGLKDVGSGYKVQAQQGTPVYAAIDLGTNNCRLLIAKRNPVVTSFGRVPSLHSARGISARHVKLPFRVLHSYSRVVRLGEGLAHDGTLNKAAMTRTIEALKICTEHIKRKAVTRIHCIATQACRIARNAGDFFDLIDEQTGLTFEIINGEQEAQLGYMGCAPLLSPRIPYAIIFDIGGGSTELSWLHVRPGQKPQMLGSISIPWGVVTLCDRFSSEGRGITQQSYDTIKALIAAELIPFLAQHNVISYLEQERVQVMGTSGTVTTLSAIAQGLERYERRRVDGSYLAVQQIRKTSAELLAMNNKERASLGSIGTNRADLVVPGCAVLEAICDSLPIARLRIADRGLREGLLYQMMESDAIERQNRRLSLGNKVARNA